MRNTKKKSARRGEKPVSKSLKGWANYIHTHPERVMKNK